MQTGKLTLRKCQSAKPREGGKQAWYGDGGGLWLAVGPNSRSWVFRYMVDGKARWMGIGSFDTVGLAEAREKARLLRAKVHRKPEDGGPVDPMHERQAAEIVKEVAASLKVNRATIYRALGLGAAGRKRSAA